MNAAGQDDKSGASASGSALSLKQPAIAMLIKAIPLMKKTFPLSLVVDHPPLKIKKNAEAAASAGVAQSSLLLAL